MPFTSIQSTYQQDETPCFRKRLVPFPYAEYFYNYPGNSGPFADSVYNDQTLDAVQLNVRLGGDAAAWGSTEYPVYYGSGLLPAASPTGIDVEGGMYYPEFDQLDTWRYTGSFTILPPLSDKYVDTSQNFATGPGAPQPLGTKTFPGVASTSPWYGTLYPDFIQVPCYGRPISYEFWYSDNPTKTNPNVIYSGYTHFGDSNNELPTGNYNPVTSNLMTEVDGYCRRYVGGIVKQGADLATLTTQDIMFGVLFIGTPTGGTGYVCVNGTIRKTMTVNYKPYQVQGLNETAWGNWPVHMLEGGTQGWDFMELGVRSIAMIDALAPPDFVGVYLGDDPHTPIDTYEVKWAWYYDFVPDAGPGTFCGLIFCNPPRAYTHPGWPCASCPEPEPMVPFPYTTFYHNGGESPHYVGEWYDNTYYNDPTLDGVQLNIRIGGDQQAWGLNNNTVQMNYGLQRTLDPMGIWVDVGLVFPNTNEIEQMAAIDCAWIGAPLSDKYYCPQQTGEYGTGPQTIGLRTFPGVATTNSYGLGNQISVPCFGRPVTFEAWYSDNENKLNQNVQYSGYTIYGGNNNIYVVCPQTPDGGQPGHTVRMVCGIIRKDADLATCTVADIMFGGIITSTSSTTGRWDICLNGISIDGGNYNMDHPRGYIAFTTSNYTRYPFADLDGYPQGWEIIGVFVENDNPLDAVGSYINFYDGVTSPLPYSGIDTFNTKWAWYQHYLPDAGEGTYCGTSYAEFPMMYTHPGWPCNGAPSSTEPRRFVPQYAQPAPEKGGTGFTVGDTMTLLGTKQFYFSQFNTDTAINPTTNTIVTPSPHQWSTGSRVLYEKRGGTKAIGLTDNATYYIRSVTPTSITLHPTLSDATNNTNPVDLTLPVAGFPEFHRLTSRDSPEYSYLGSAVVGPAVFTVSSLAGIFVDGVDVTTPSAYTVKSPNPVMTNPVTVGNTSNTEYTVWWHVPYLVDPTSVSIANAGNAYTAGDILTLGTTDMDFLSQTKFIVNTVGLSYPETNFYAQSGVSSTRDLITTNAPHPWTVPTYTEAGFSTSATGVVGATNNEFINFASPHPWTVPTYGEAAFLTSSAGINSTTDVITTLANHNFTTGDGVEYQKRGAAGTPGGLTEFVVYYVRVLTPTTVTMHTTQAGAIGNTARITTLTTSGTNTHYLQKVVANNPDPNGIPVQYEKRGGVAAIGLTDFTTYYVRVRSSTQISLHTSASNAINNLSKVNLTASGTETHYLRTNVAEAPDTNGYAVVYEMRGGTSSIGLTDGATYYARFYSDTTLTLHPTAQDAIDNTNRINLTAATNETHYLRDTVAGGSQGPITSISILTNPRIGLILDPRTPYSLTGGTGNGATISLSFVPMA